MRKASPVCYEYHIINTCLYPLVLRRVYFIDVRPLLGGWVKELMGVIPAI